MARRIPYVNLLVVLVAFSGVVAAQPVAAVRQFEMQGRIKALAAGRVDITDQTGKSWSLKIGRPDDDAVSLGGARVVRKMPARIKVSGQLPLEVVHPGMPIGFHAKMTREGQITEPVDKLYWLDEENFKPGIKPSGGKSSRDQDMQVAVVGDVEGIRGQRMLVRVPRSRHAHEGRLLAPVTEDAVVLVESTELSKVRPGSHVTRAEVVEFSTGDLVIKSLEIQLDGKAADEAPQNDAAAAEYRKYSDQQGMPQPYRGRHFIVYTDDSERSARELLDKLEQMLGLMSRYYGQLPRGVVECYVVHDLNAWPPNAFTAEAKQKIASQAGLTVTQQLGRQIKSVVYACDKHDVVQHEAVHAFCHQTFGGVGPTWYAEGMAEMGRFWKPAEKAVDVDPVVIDYITKAKQPKTVRELVTEEQITGDSWEAYAWRWALCHLLANNPNYSRRFKNLGLALMRGQPNVSFESAYGPMARQLSFEYDQFIRHIGNGYRVDSCAWDWTAEFAPLEQEGHETIRVRAKAGWQPTGVRVTSEGRYDYVANGQWNIDAAGAKVTADGIRQGAGQLTAVVMSDDYALSDPLPLGASGSFTAPMEGNLYVRCREPWTRLGDNSGEITAYIRLSREAR